MVNSDLKGLVLLISVDIVDTLFISVDFLYQFVFSSSNSHSMSFLGREAEEPDICTRLHKMYDKFQKLVTLSTYFFALDFLFRLVRCCLVNMLRHCCYDKMWSPESHIFHKCRNANIIATYKQGPSATEIGLSL